MNLRHRSWIADWYGDVEPASANKCTGYIPNTEHRYGGFKPAPAYECTVSSVHRTSIQRCRRNLYIVVFWDRQMAQSRCCSVQPSAGAGMISKVNAWGHQSGNIQLASMKLSVRWWNRFLASLVMVSLKNEKIKRSLSVSTPCEILP